MFTKPSFRRGFTLIELMITLTIFAVVAIISITALVNAMRSAKKIQAQVFLYSEAQSLMDIIARDIERNAIDYETYYARNVLGESGWETTHYGDYAQTFYDPGDEGWDSSPYGGGVPDYYGTDCPSDASLHYPEDCSSEVPSYDDLDTDMGTHPFPYIYDYTGYSSSIDATWMNALCEGSTRYGDADCADFANAYTDEIILMNSAGDHRIVYRLDFSEGSTSEYSIYRIALDGTDMDGDGLVETWRCSSNYDCPTGDVPTSDDFVALSSTKLHIANFDVLIAPMEDPYRGFGEDEIQVQPYIQISMRIDLSTNYSQGLLGDTPSITLQRTVSTGVYQEVSSYE